MKEYLVEIFSGENAQTITKKLNALAEEGWQVFSVNLAVANRIIVVYTFERFISPK